MATTFVSCMFQYNESVLAEWLTSGLNMILFVKPADFVVVENVIQTKNMDINMKIKTLPEISEVEWYTNSASLNLPSDRNEKKDTLEHLWNMHLKVYCTRQAVISSDFKSEFFAYIDFDISHMLKTPAATMVSIRENYSQPHLFVSRPNDMHFPGCWGKQTDKYTANKINWRFCGSFFFGKNDAILQFYHHHTLYFREFLEISENTMTWEVNFWAYLEAKADHWNPVWYAANHDDTIVRIPEIFGYKILLEEETEKKTKITVYNYPNMSPYRPMSAAYVEYLGKSYLNTRYVNYWIYGNGGYYYPEDEGVIRTLNVCSELSSDVGMPFDYQPMTETVSRIALQDENENSRPKTFFSEGIEDIRLYVSQETGDLCFIGSTLSYSHVKDKIRTIRGVYDVDTHTCRELQPLDPPTETWCEKNWAPIPLAGSDGFIYKWFPLEIGKVSSEGKLEIVVRKEMDGRFRHMKGSTAFTFFDKKSLIGVVHFSEEMHPRQYYHRVVVLDAETYGVVKCSDIFCFEKASVEFCIGCKVIGDNRMGFWISRMDRDPMYVETEMKCIMEGGNTQ